MRCLFLIVILIISNLAYSIYALQVSKRYTETLRQYKAELEKNLTLRTDINRIISYQKAKKEARDEGFKPVNWERVKLVR
ncbi:hypothetical protein Thal_0150 [Thermocrinis albus DSM 14484]|uniref:Uncharacterized protein n=1 Tax=Thermocrinis albus (strain DSM 14484 / JCM 11386 / HI 11/12) TaxID=638303 RepID=D3SNP9_THEAH|nr:hypothetical protein [Thermocrinis albus]ADC88786.1 hypothetical protein Thal_0150 [Thermocrinis albus DSM 14484]